MSQKQLEHAQKSLRQFVEKEKVISNTRFFKTQKGEYAEGIQFLGVSVPNIRRVVKEYRLELALEEIEVLLHSLFHEERMLAVLLLVAQYKLKRLGKREAIYDFYMANATYINNWDLVDVSAPHIVGMHLLDKKRDVLYTFARSQNLWQKRISILASFAFIKHGEFKDTLAIAKILLHDEHDLIHKAVGWSLRNVASKDLNLALAFLREHQQNMPRVMLRYAIEKFDATLRAELLRK